MQAKKWLKAASCGVLPIKDIFYHFSQMGIATRSELSESNI
jgi:hypothetical protein